MLTDDEIKAVVNVRATTDELVAHFTETTDIPPAMLSDCIGPAIDAIYSVRDAGGMMHAAGAAAAVATLKAARAAPPATAPIHERQSLRKRSGGGAKTFVKGDRVEDVANPDRWGLIVSDDCAPYDYSVKWQTGEETLVRADVIRPKGAG